jgi:arginine-tRNA-protein transferase
MIRSGRPVELNQRVQIPLRHFFATPPTPCPYLDGRMERKVVTLLAGEDPDQLHEALSQAGFRRSQDLAYRPACDGCSACKAVRIPARAFRANRTQRRTIARNNDLTALEISAQARPEHFHLFHRYLAERHADGGMADMDYSDYRAMVEDSPVRTHIVEFRDADGGLAAVCLTDRMRDGLSLVYSFFDPDLHHRSLGQYMILWHIQRAGGRGLDYVYLGYWIADSQKMAYKASFRPLEILTSRGWTPFRDDEHTAEPASVTHTGQQTASFEVLG